MPISYLIKNFFVTWLLPVGSRPVGVAIERTEVSIICIIDPRIVAPEESETSTLISTEWLVDILGST